MIFVLQPCYSILSRLKFTDIHCTHYYPYRYCKHRWYHFRVLHLIVSYDKRFVKHTCAISGCCKLVRKCTFHAVIWLNATSTTIARTISCNKSALSKHNFLFPRHSSEWRHNERDGVSNHRHLDCLIKRLFRRRSKKTAKVRVIGLCEAVDNRKNPKFYLPYGKKDIKL